jgi:AmiR/NasT family two-component response regulator
MDRHELSADGAFELLARIGQYRRCKVCEVAREIAETGAVQLPPSVELVSELGA